MKLIVGFSKPKSKWAIGSLLIRLCERSEFSHSFLRWHSNGIDRDMIYHASHGMVHFISGERFDESTQTIRQYCATLTDDQHREVMRKCVDLAGVKYGTLTLLGMGFERLTGIRSPFRDGDETYVCSELIAEVLKQCNIANINLDLELAGPKQLELAVASILPLVKNSEE